MSSVKYFETPAKKPPRRRTFREWVKDLLLLGNPKPLPGRNRIDPSLPYGSWFKGWDGPVFPQKRNKEA
jgi:hypothetical protein